MANLFQAIASRFKKKDEEDQLAIAPTPKIDFGKIAQTAGKAVQAIAAPVKQVNSYLGFDKPTPFSNAPAPVKFLAEPTYKNLRAGYELVNLPSYAVGGAIKEFKAQPEEKLPEKISPMDMVNLNNKMGNTLFQGLIKGVKNKTPIMDELPKAANVDPLSAPGLALGFAGEVLTPDPFDVVRAGKAGVKALQNSDEVASVIKSALKINPVDLEDAFASSVEVKLKDVMDVLKKYKLPEEFASKIKSGEPIVGDNFVIQFQNKAKKVLVNIDKKFEPVVPEVSKAIDKAEFIDSKVVADKLGGKVGGEKEIAKLKMPEYWKPEEIDRNQVEAVKLSIQNGGKIDPIVIDTTGNVLDGSHRLEALKELGIKKVQTVVQDVKITEPKFEIPKIEIGGSPALPINPIAQGKVDLSSIKGFNQLPSPTETKLLGGESAPLTGVESRQYKKKYGSLPNQVTESLPSSTTAIRLPAEAEDLSKVGPELGSFTQEAMQTAGESGTENILDAAVDMARSSSEKAEEFIVPINEGGSQLMPEIQNLPKALQDAYQYIYQYRVKDLPLDQKLKGLERAKLGLESSITLTYNQAKETAKNILGRTLNEGEAGALLRGQFSKEFKFAQEGVTDMNLGEDILSKQKELTEAFNPVHEEIASNVIMYEQELDNAIAKGFLTAERAREMRLVDPKKFAENLKTYVRTVYDKSVQELPDADLNLNIVDDVALSFSASKKKLTDAEWGRAYYQAYKNLQAEQVSKSTDIPIDLLTKIEAGDEGAFGMLGRKVKELRGYVFEGDKAVQKTLNYLSNQWADLKTFNMLGDRPDLFSKEFQTGFTKVPVDKRYGPMQNMYIRSDIAEAFKFEYKYKDMVDTIPGFIDWFGAIWRASRTILNPATYGLNFMTGLLGMQTMAGNTPFNPMNWKYFGKAAKEFGEYSINGVTKSPELTEFLKGGGQMAVFADSVILEGLGDAFENSKTTKDLSSKLYNLVVKGSDTLENAGKWFSTADVFNKYATYLNKVDNGFSPVEAMQIADKYHLNYDLAPKFVRFIKNTPILNTVTPFLSFPILFTKMFVETAVAKPWRMIPFLLVPQSYTMQWKLRNPELADDYERQKPYYLKNNPFVIPVGYDESTKEFSYFDMASYFNIPTTAEEGARSLFGPFAGNLGGPFSAVSDVVRGTDAFGRPLNTPYSNSTGEHLAKGILPLPPIVNQVADFFRTLQGKTARGKLREPLDEALRMVGISISKGPVNQLEKNVNAIKADYAEWKSWASKQLMDPNLSESGRQEILKSYEDRRQEYIKGVQGYLEESMVPTDKASMLSLGIAEGLTTSNETDVLTSFLQTGVLPIALTDNPTLNGSTGSGKLKIKGASVAKPSMSFKVSIPKSKVSKGIALKTFKPLTPPKIKLNIASRNPNTIDITNINSIASPHVSGLNVS